MVSCSDACWFLAAANCNPRPHASRRPGSAAKLSVGDVRYQYAMRYAYGWIPLGRHRYQYLLVAAVMAGQNVKMQVRSR